MPPKSSKLADVAETSKPTETSSLLGKSSPPPASPLWFWEPAAPSFRFFILFLATIVPFGGHCVKYSTAALNSDLTGDPEFGLTHAEFGTFQSAVSVPNLFVPFVGGMLLDVRGSAYGTIGALFLCLIGHAMFSYACMIKSYLLAVSGRAVFGLGQGSTVVAQGHIAATYFVGYELVFAVALTESSHNLANWVAMVYVVPASNYFGSYIAALWVGVFICFLSFLAGIVYFKVNDHESPNEIVDEEMASHSDEFQHEPTCPLYTAPSTLDHGHGGHTHGGGEKASVWALVSDSKTSVGFVTLCFLHLVFSNCYHLFGYISADFLQQKWNSTTADATWMASLSNGFAIFLCPFAGFCLDRIGYKMHFCSIFGVVTAVAYLMLAYTQITPALSMLILAVCIAFVPTILRSSVPNLVHPTLFGSAYGVYEVCESLGALPGHALVGYLRDTTASYEIDMLLFAGMGLVAGLGSFFLSVYDSYYGGTLNEPSRLSERTREIDQQCTCANPEIKRAHALSIVAVQAPKGYVRSTSIVELRRRSLM